MIIDIMCKNSLLNEEEIDLSITIENKTLKYSLNKIYILVIRPIIIIW